MEHEVETRNNFSPSRFSEVCAQRRPQGGGQRGPCTTFSKSVADAIAYARDTLQLQNFVGSEATEKFIRVINDGFDIQNTSKLKDCGFKSPLQAESKNRIFSRMDEISEYLSELQDVRGTKICVGGRKIGFLGFIMNFQTIKKLYDIHVEHGPMDFLLTNKLSQDHLEHFFGRYFV